LRCVPVTTCPPPQRYGGLPVIGRGEIRTRRGLGPRDAGRGRPRHLGALVFLDTIRSHGESSDPSPTPARKWIAAARAARSHDRTPSAHQRELVPGTGPR
jgi:hypothetical protein